MCRYASVGRDQEFQAGFTCNGLGATPTTPIPTQPDGGCLASRNLSDASVGADDLFHGDRYKGSLRFTVINLTNKVALYNFFSTFSGTHYVTPRSETVELGFHF